MKKTLSTLSLLLSTALAGAVPASARDLTQDILGMPSMSAISRPEVTEPAPAADVKTKLAPAKVEPASGPAAAPGYVVEILPPADDAEKTPMASVTTTPNTDIMGILSQAYADSPILRAQREVLRGQYEEVAQAEANKRPTISVDAGLTAQHTDTDPGVKDTFVTKDAGLTATQYLYRGGRTLAEVDQQLRLSDAAQAAYDSVVQDTLLKVVTAAMDVQRDRATIELNEKNLQVITKQLDAAKRGFEVGELTRTDVAQAQARLSGSMADLVSAKADYSSALARFEQYAGISGADVSIDMTSVPTAVPVTVEEAATAAKADHPDLRAARFSEQAAASAVKAAEGALLPTISLSGALSQAWDPTALLDESRSAALGVRASMPLYEGGATRSQIRQAKIGQYQKRDEIQVTERTVQKDIATAWNDYTSAKSTIDAYEKQVEAAQLARDGVYKEREVGQRTVLDTLNADAELLDAQVGLVRAQRDAVVAAFALKAATGGLTGEKLGFSKPDETGDYREVARSDLFGTDVEPVR